MTKYCTYPDCNCPFDMDSDNRCLVNLPQKNEIDKMNKVYSSDNEVFHDEIEEVINNLLCDGLFNIGDTVMIYEGEKVELTHNQYVNDLDIIGILENIACDDMGEFSDSYLSEITKENKEELCSLISGYLYEKCGNPNFYKVKNVSEIEVILE